MWQIIILFTTGMRHWFYGSLHDEIVDAFEQSKFPLTPRFETVVKDEEYAAVGAVMKLQKLENEKVLDGAAALVVVPTESHRLSQKVAEVQLHRKREGRPLVVVALNLPFSHPDEFTKRGLPVPKVVVSHDTMGAAALGQDAARYLEDRPSPVHAVFIPGQYDRVDSQNRRVGFFAGLSDALPRHVVRRVTDLAPGNWSRREAAALMAAHLASTPDRVDVVFAANDEMALGVRDAILTAPERFRAKAANCVVYGYDGIDEAAHLVEDLDPIFKGTVDQNLSAMAVRLAEVVSEGEAVDGRPEYITPNPRVQCPDSPPPPPDPWAPPEYDPAPGIWLSAHDAAERDEESMDALRQARSRHWGRRRIERDTGGESEWAVGGIDRKGRVWIQMKSGGKVWYLASYLLRGPVPTAPEAEAVGAGSRPRE